MSAGADALPNATELAADARREERRLIALALPALAVIGLVVIVPTGALFWVSFVGKGGFTLANYARMAAQPAYLDIFYTTFSLSMAVTLICMLLGYPLAYLMSQLSGKVALVTTVFVLLPFWTSLLVRTYSWTIILRRNGLINQALIALGLSDRPVALLYNATGTVIGMVHIMLPFLVLPLYAAMKTISRDLERAAASLGASSSYVFWSVYFPLTVPGLMAGMLLVFIYCLGFYVTPALLGGGHVTFVGMKVFDDVQIYDSWGPASALGLALLAVTLVFFYLISRLVDVTRWLGRA